MVSDSLGKGRLRSAWTHGLPAQQQHQHEQQQQHQLPAVLSGGGAWGSAGAGLADGGGLQQLPGQHSHQTLHHLHHHQPQHTTVAAYDHQHQQQQQYYGSRGGGGEDAGGDTPKKLLAASRHSFLLGAAAGHQPGGGGSAYRSRRCCGWLPVGCGRLDREILVNALACAGASMSDPLMSMVDSYYAGKLGTTSLAALGSNGALFSVLYFLCFTALAVLCTQAMATANSRRDAEGCGRGFIQAAAATAVVSSLLVLLLLTLPEFLLGLFQTGPEVMELAKTYCMIRALSLPAALAMNVSQAAFRSLLDLTTPFCVVMTANAANALLNQLLMVVLPYGMAGCGWASVASQYTGALLFACLIYRRRHAFGIPQALAGAEDAFYARMQGKHWPAAAPAPSSKPSTGGSSTLVAKKVGGSARLATGVRGGGGGGSSSAAYAGSPSKAGGGGSGRGSRRTSRQSSRDVSPRARGSPRRSRESSGTLRIDVAAFEQHLAKYQHSGAAAGDSRLHEGGDPADFEAGLDPNSPARRRSSRLHSSSDGGGGGGGRLARGSSLAGAGPFAAAAAGASGALAAAAAEGPGGDADFELHRWDSAGSESKLPRYLVNSSNSSWWRLGVLLRSLDWGGFARRFAGMTTRGLLILSCYTSANVVAAKGGTAMMAAHQVVQQQQQLQMSFAWSFLHVGQSMTANLFHSTAPGGGPAAARLLSQRIISWALASCVTLACGTYLMRRSLPAIFTQDAEVQALVWTASLPAAVMLGLGWNNALEGCLLAADQQPYVVKVYPWAVASALGMLATGSAAGAGLPGVWAALMTYYLVLLVGFAARYYWMQRLGRAAVSGARGGSMSHHHHAKE